MIKTRPIARADLAVVLTMIQELSAHHDDVAQVTFEQLERDTMGSQPWVRVIVATENDALVGYAALVPRAKFHSGQRAMDVHHLFVLDDWRSKGVGQVLLDACQDLARDLGCSALTIGTDPDNTHAQAVYERYGFERIEVSNPHFRLEL